MNWRGVLDRRPNHESAPEIRNMAGIPHGKQNPAKADSSVLRSWLETSQLTVVNTSETWKRRMP